MSKPDERLTYEQARARLVELGVIDDEGDGALVPASPVSPPPSISQER